MESSAAQFGSARLGAFGNKLSGEFRVFYPRAGRSFSAALYLGGDQFLPDQRELTSLQEQRGQLWAGEVIEPGKKASGESLSDAKVTMDRSEKSV